LDYLHMPKFNLLSIAGDLDSKKKDSALMAAAMAQHELKERFQDLKTKDVSEIVQQAKDYIQDSETKSSPSLFFRVVKNKPEVYDIISRSLTKK